MAANYDYLTRIRSLISLHSTKLTSNVLEGSFRSTYRARSLDFDDLREYTWGDNVKDIDWRSSARTGKTLVRRFVAERRHNIMIVADCGEKMDASSSFGEDKAQLAVDVVGTIAYIALLHGDDVALMSGGATGISYTGFHGSRNHVETCLASYDRDVRTDGPDTLDAMFDHVVEAIGRKMILFVVTDMAGLESLHDRALAKLAMRNDVLIVDIDDAYMFGNSLWDTETGEYEAEMILSDPKLQAAELADRRARLEDADRRCRHYGAHLAVIGRESEIPDRMVELLQEARNS